MNGPIWFDESIYLKNKAAQCGLPEADTLNAIHNAGMDLFTHYVRYGEAEGLAPNELFNPVQYARAVAESWNDSAYKGFSGWGESDVLALVQGFGVTLYDHFSQVGWLQSINTSNAFNVAAYMQDKAAAVGLSVADTSNAFVAAGLDAVTHYMLGGKGEGIPVTSVPLEDAVRAASTYNALPDDPLFAQQWHLFNTGQNGATPGIDLDVLSAWQAYSGKGVLVGVVDNGIDFDHPDIAANINAEMSRGVGNTDGQPIYDNYIDKEENQQAGDSHGMACSGLVGAVANNGLGGVGVAPEATLASLYVKLIPNPTDIGDTSLYEDALRSLDFDILSNSWGDVQYYLNYHNIEAVREDCSAEKTAATLGRDGKGCVVLLAAGNDNDSGNDAALNSTHLNPYSISVGAIDMLGQAVTYSTPGSRVLIAAPSQNLVYDPKTGRLEPIGGIVTTDRQGELGYNEKPSPEGDYNDTFSGTSASCPQAAGVVALMLEANPELGYRDVSDILALSARNTNPTDPMWVENGADNWNGGGLSHHRQVGFGLIDATAAVRLAETWTAQSTEANRVTVTRYADVNTFLPDGDGRSVSSSVIVEENMQVEQATVFMNLSHSYGPDVEVRLVSPSGTVSTLLNDRWSGEAGKGLKMKDINVMVSVGFMGEDSRGEWTLEVVDKTTNYRFGTLHNWTMELCGKPETADDTYIYTDDFARLATDPSRTILHDAEGYNTINAAAVSTDINLDLRVGHTGNYINGAQLTLADGTSIQRLFTGDGNDTVVTNNLGNTINTGRGNDLILVSGPGNNLIDGGTGINTVQFFGNSAEYEVDFVEGHVVVTHQTGVTELNNVQILHFADLTAQIDFMVQFA